MSNKYWICFFHNRRDQVQLKADPTPLPRSFKDLKTNAIVFQTVLLISLHLLFDILRCRPPRADNELEYRPKEPSSYSHRQKVTLLLPQVELT